MIVSLTIFAVVNLTLLAVTGVHFGGDTGLFLDGARRLLEGQPLVEREPSYLGYVAVVAATQALGGGLMGVVLLQIAVATLGAGAVYRLGMELGGARAGTVATGLLTLDLDVNRWHTYVLADSLFLSVFAVSAWTVHRASGGRDWRRYGVALLVLVVGGLIRPEGWLALAAAGFYWVARGLSGPARLVASAAVAVGCVVAALIVAPLLSGNLSAVNPAGMLERGQTIWEYDGWRLAMPDSAHTAETGQARGAVAYAVQHPLATTQLMLARVGVHLVHVRPFYSAVHNAVIVLWLLPVYALALFALWSAWDRPIARWLVAAFGSQALVVALTHADWDGRYLAHVMPVVYPLTALGAGAMIARRTAVARAA